MTARLTKSPLSLFLLFPLALMGCSPYEGSCSWLQPVDGTAVTVTGQRRAVPSECRCIGCSAPGEFSLKREKYTIEIWNGNRWYPELALRARAPDGSKLHLRSPQLVSLENSEPLMGRWPEFDYFLPGPFGKSAGHLPPVRLRVESSSGELLGEESLQFELLVRKDYSIEFL